MKDVKQALSDQVLIFSAQILFQSMSSVTCIDEDAGVHLVREVEGLADRLRHIKDPTPGRVNDKEEAVSGGDYQLLQLLVGQHRRLVVALSVAIQAAADRFQVLNCQA